MIDTSEIGTIKPKSKNRSHNYIEIKYDIEGWAKTEEWKPADFDLCFLRDKNGNTKIGWRSSGHWDGLNVSYGEEFPYWKRKKD